MNFQTLKNILRKLQDSVRESGRLSPARDWFMLLMALALLIVASVAWSSWFFLSITKTENMSVVESVTETAGNDVVGEAERVFIQRESEARRFDESALFVDPSE